MKRRLLARAAWAVTCGQAPRSLASTACAAASTTFSRGLHVEAAAAAHAAAGTTASPQQRPAGLGQALPHLARTGCIYLDYNATTPIFPEVHREWVWDGLAFSIYPCSLTGRQGTSEHCPPWYM